MKTCITCKEEKPLEDFYRYKRAKDGRQSKCKSCKKKEDKEQYDYKSNKEDIFCIDCDRNMGKVHKNKLRCERCKIIENRRIIKEYHTRKRTENPQEYYGYIKSWRTKNKKEIQSRKKKREQMEGKPQKDMEKWNKQLNKVWREL